MTLLVGELYAYSEPRDYLYCDAENELLFLGFNGPKKPADRAFNLNSGAA